MESGAPYVMMGGTIVRLKLFVDNWDLEQEVIFSIKTFALIVYFY